MASQLSLFTTRYEVSNSAQPPGEDHIRYLTLPHQPSIDICKQLIAGVNATGGINETVGITIHPFVDHGLRNLQVKLQSQTISQEKALVFDALPGKE